MEHTKRVLLLSLCLSLVARMTVIFGQGSEYTIGARDVLAVTVWSQMDLSGKYIVAADGTLTFPLIGALRVEGLTPQQAEGELRSRLKDGFFTDPQLSVSIEDYRSQRIFVIGQVRQPGSYPLSGDMTLLEALSRAGSTTADASSEALIVRVADGTKRPSQPVLPEQAASSEVIRVNVTQLQSGALTSTVILHDGDTVFVPRAEMVFVAGQVRTPGGYTLAAVNTVLQALTLAGGPTDQAATNRIRIIRIVNGKRQENKAKLDDPVKAGDTIVVPERFF